MKIKKLCEAVVEPHNADSFTVWSRCLINLEEIILLSLFQYQMKPGFHVGPEVEKKKTQ
jgi:hypothetical protein